MSLLFERQSDLHQALVELIELDPRLAPIWEQTGTPALREGEPGFAGLAAIVVGQQLSVASAAAIWRRLTEGIRPFDAATLRRAKVERLAELGLSAAKIRTLTEIATEVEARRIDLDALAELPADEAHAKLTSLHGVGPWTADVYLLFCLRLVDAWPAGDLGLQEGVRRGLGLATRPTTSEMREIAQIWRPFRGAAAHLWWAYHKLARARERP